MFFAPAASPVVTAPRLADCRPFGHLAGEQNGGRILLNRFLLAVCPAVVMIGHWTTEQGKETLQQSATLVT